MSQSEPLRPPFRADMVGSLLRSDAIKSARKQYQADEISADQLRRVEDEEIRRVVAHQESLGLKAVTDGEFRRAWWHFDFLEQLHGVEGYTPEQGIQFQGRQTPSRGIRVVDRVRFNPDHTMLDDFRFLDGITQHSVAKMTIPSPSVLHFRVGRNRISREVYPELDAFFDDVAEAWREAIHAFHAAGCRYLQLDDTVWAYLCSDRELEAARQRGEEQPEQLQYRYAEVLNRALRDRPADMHVSLHVCRGNFRSTWISEGGYEPVAETLLGGVDVDAFFLEYDSDRAGGFEPLRFLPRGHQQAVLGMITTKNGELEAKSDIRRRFQEASLHAPLDQLCLSPQCGFASTEEGNQLSEDEQWAKLGLVVELADEIWD
ncbi:cobalamin-independent methionine synthase II family protein [Kushneria phosphatilytica]|uniref:Cobalamin-independent methionine synthase II family protein n=1 Tax=Kushneria phosphatilytica TaxID=657387 RepID=A0A1S1NX82_9GAMM|nr:cobalamin-independent methionine synthase II family protein [Kushneria phosphatilytica]OHV12170.1 5-methyltetrahydropteroyltriglutamate--homocysteine S-methyltransferase [Kushneria phosphatilytica]QEL11364.1 cobalamin-independent methionine synthase II family protein [Kushneria phosphatilytica]